MTLKTSYNKGVFLTKATISNSAIYVSNIKTIVFYHSKHSDRVIFPTERQNGKCLLLFVQTCDSNASIN